MFNLERCNEANLADEESCMKDEELAEYFAPMMFTLSIYETRVDYEDIEDPLKTSIQDVAVN